MAKKLQTSTKEKILAVNRNNNQNQNQETLQSPSAAEPEKEEQWADTDALQIKRTIKDSVFTHLFREPEYLYQLYQTLHPEDQKTKPEDLTDITIRNVLTENLYNDLSFLVNGKQIILMEAQATWTVNIIVRSLLYLVKNWRDYLKQTGQNLYHTKPVEIPKAELYVIYTGKRKKRPERIMLSREFFDGAECAVEATVSAIYERGTADIINQYICFAQEYDKNRKRYADPKQIIKNTLETCKNRGFLAEYLKQRETEVIGIMESLFDEEEILKNYLECARRAAEQKGLRKGEKRGRKIGEERGQKIGTMESSRRHVMRMLEKNVLSEQEIAEYVPEISLEEIRKMKKQMQVGTA